MPPPCLWRLSPAQRFERCTELRNAVEGADIDTFSLFIFMPN